MPHSYPHTFATNTSKKTRRRCIRKVGKIMLRHTQTAYNFEIFNISRRVEWRRFFISLNFKIHDEQRCVCVCVWVRLCMCFCADVMLLLKCHRERTIFSIFIFEHYKCLFISYSMWDLRKLCTYEFFKNYSYRNAFRKFIVLLNEPVNYSLWFLTCDTVTIFFFWWNL